MRISDWSSDVCSSDLMHRADEAQPVVTIRHGVRVDRGRGQADADREDHRAVRDALADILRRAPDGIHMMREEIAGMAGVNDEIGFGDRAPETGASRTVFLLLAILFNDTRWAPSGRCRRRAGGRRVRW